MAPSMRAKGLHKETRRVTRGSTTPQSTPSTQPPPSAPTQGEQTQKCQETVTDLVETIYNVLSAVESSPTFSTNHTEDFATIRNALEKIQDTVPATPSSVTEGVEILLNELKHIKKDIQV